jgi:hypothetical protein
MIHFMPKIKRSLASFCRKMQELLLGPLVAILLLVVTLNDTGRQQIQNKQSKNSQLVFSGIKNILYK